MWLWGQIHPVIFHLALFYCLACSAELRSYSWSKISLSSLSSFRGLYRCCTKSQPPVNSCYLVVSSSRLRVSRQRAGSSCWLDWLLPGLRNQKLIWSPLGLVKLISQAQISSRQNLGFDMWRERAWFALLPAPWHSRCSPFPVCPGHPGPSTVSEATMPWKAAETAFHP